MNEKDKIEAQRAYQRAYYAANREHRLRWQKIWRDQNRELVKKRDRGYYAKNAQKKMGAVARYRRRQGNKLRRQRNKETALSSPNHCRAWTYHELQFLVSRTDLSSFEISRVIGRSWYAVSRMRSLIKRGLVKERFDFNNPGEGI